MNLESLKKSYRPDFQVDNALAILMRNGDVPFFDF
jgi:hypothetical protein